MSPRTAGRGNDRTVTLELVWADADLAASEAGHVGLQDTSGELTPPAAVDGTDLHYRAEVRVREGAGPVALRGPYVHGPAGERFAYLSFREPGGQGWRRRLKIMLPDGLEKVGDTLSLRFHDDGGSRARPEEPGWSTS